jgi:hypothetical protein
MLQDKDFLQSVQIAVPRQAFDRFDLSPCHLLQGYLASRLSHVVDDDRAHTANPLAIASVLGACQAQFKSQSLQKAPPRLERDFHILAIHAKCN